MAMKPTVSRLEKEYEGRVEFRSLDIDDAANDAAKQQFNFLGQPQFVLALPDGKVVSSRNGGQRYETLKKDIEKALAASALTAQ